MTQIPVQPIAASPPLRAVALNLLGLLLILAGMLAVVVPAWYFDWKAGLPVTGLFAIAVGGFLATREA